MKCFFLFVASLMLTLSTQSQAEVGAPKSGKRLSSFGDTAAVGVSIDNKTVTGYYHFTNRSMPDHSFQADCVILFSGGVINNNEYAIYATDAAKQIGVKVKGKLFFDGAQKFSSKAPVEQLFRIKLKENIPTCSDAVDVSDFDLQFTTNDDGDWKYVSAVKVKRTYFHNEPSDKSVSKAFLLAGDLIYVYDEKPEWYYVKYQGRKKETVGWIKKSDTIQLP